MRRLAAVLLSLALVLPARAAEVFEPAPELPAATAAPETAQSQRSPGIVEIPASVPAPALAQGLLPSVEASLTAQNAQTASSPKAETVLSAVAGAKQPETAQASAYDGSKIAGPAETPVAAPSPAPAPKQPGFLKRLNRATDSRPGAERWLERSVPLGIAAAVVAPVLWKASSPGTILYSAPLALTAMLLLFGGVTFYRAARFLVLRRDPREGRKEHSRLAAAIAGLVLGVGLGVAPMALQPQILERGAALVAPETGVRAVHGDALRDAVIERLSRNPEGRDVLNQLKDRAGFVHMPRFYIADSRDAVAEYNGTFDAVFINAAEVKDAKTTVDDFARDPVRQRAFAKNSETTLAHELRHGDQARRSIREAVDFKDSRESEYEAYITEVRFIHAQLKENPKVELGSSEFGQYLGALDGFDAFIKGVDGSYPNVHEDTPYYREFLARQRAEWPRLMVEGNMLLAERNAASPKMAARYVAAARKVAAQYGLPDPRS